MKVCNRKPVSSRARGSTFFIPLININIIMAENQGAQIKYLMILDFIPTFLVIKNKPAS